MKQPYLQIGNGVVDLINPKAEQIDLRAVEQNLWTAHRFTNNPKALTVRQHTTLVRDLAVMLNGSPAAIRWSEHHDDHEGIIGDIPGPLKTYIERAATEDTLSLSDIEIGLDVAICGARGIDVPDDMIRQEVHFYDKLAETLEWLFVLGRDPEPWNKVWRNYLGSDEAQALLGRAKALKPPRGLIPE